MKVLFTILCFYNCFWVQAQKAKNSEQAILNDFVKICNNIKQEPLQLQMQLKKTSNYLNAYDDTATLVATINVQEANVHMRIGEVEQLANDSLLVMILHSQKQIIVNENAGGVAAVKKLNFLPVSTSDSAINSLKEKFSFLQEKQKGKNTIKLIYKEVVELSNLPKQEIVLNYNETTMQPNKIAVVVRQLLPVKTSMVLDSSILILKDEANKSFFVKVDTMNYLYEKITHKAEDLPLTVFDKIKPDAENKYTAVKELAAYRVSVF
jgi:hypothetical protein